jgi:octopine/nopaline transport system ATP-binding protein
MNSLFPQNDLEARQRFFKATTSLEVVANEAGVKKASFLVPSATETDLFVDTLFYPAKKQARRLFILSSGVHGMEASTGSAIQEMFFKEFFPQLNRDHLSLFVVHGLNPYGFRRSRRATENNVNLNRNFAITSDHFKTPNPGYKRLARHLAPKKPLAKSRLRIFSAIRFVALAHLMGFSAAKLNQALAQGQFEFASGIEYGGAGLEPQTAFLQDQLRPLIPLSPDVVLFDLHTGLGLEGELHLLRGDHSASFNESLFSEIMGEKKRRGIYSYTSADTPGFYKTIGDFNSWIAATAKTEQRVLALTLEYGTLGNNAKSKLESLKRLVNENTGFHQGYKSSEVESRVKEELAELFSPSSEAWQLNALERARQVFVHALKNLTK